MGLGEWGERGCRERGLMFRAGWVVVGGIGKDK